MNSVSICSIQTDHPILVNGTTTAFSARTAEFIRRKKITEASDKPIPDYRGSVKLSRRIIQGAIYQSKKYELFICGGELKKYFGGMPDIIYYK